MLKDSSDTKTWAPEKDMITSDYKWGVVKGGLTFERGLEKPGKTGEVLRHADSKG